MCRVFKVVTYITHLLQARNAEHIFACFCSLAGKLFLKRLVITYLGWRQSPGLSCNFLAWLTPPAYHRKARRGSYISEGAARRGTAVAHRPVFTAAMKQTKDQCDYFCTAQEHTCNICSYCIINTNAVWVCTKLKKF